MMKEGSRNTPGTTEQVGAHNAGGLLLQHRDDFIVDHDFDAHLFDPARDDDAVTCPACGGRCRVQGEDCPLCDGEGSVVL